MALFEAGKTNQFHDGPVIPFAYYEETIDFESFYFEPSRTDVGFLSLRK